MVKTHKTVGRLNDVHNFNSKFIKCDYPSHWNKNKIRNKKSPTKNKMCAFLFDFHDSMKIRKYRLEHVIWYRSTRDRHLSKSIAQME